MTLFYQTFLLQIVSLPILGAMIIWCTGAFQKKTAFRISFSILAYTTLLLILTGIRVSRQGSVTEQYIIGPDISFTLLADGISLPVALVVNIICLVLCVYSAPYVDHRIELIYKGAGPETETLYFNRFFFLYLFFPTGFMGVTFATNLMAMYLFMEWLTIIPLYFIMAQFGYSDFISRYKVALICLFWGVAGATLFLIAIVMGYDQIKSFEIASFSRLSGLPHTVWIILTMLMGLSIKLAIVPFHVWMPWVHAEHPTCIAGLLAVYANIAVYIMVRVLIIPLGTDMMPFVWPIMILAFVTMTYGALLTLAQTDIKRFCACSTISQISYSVFGIGAMTIMGLKGGLFYFLSHIIGKAILFSTAGMVVYTTGTRDLTRMGGLHKKMPFTAFLWFSAALILSALPPTSGFVGKWLFFNGAFEAVLEHPAGILMVVAAVLSTLLTLVYTFSTGFKIFFGPEQTAIHPEDNPPLTMRIPVFILVALAFLLGIYPTVLLNLFEMVLV